MSDQNVTRRDALKLGGTALAGAGLPAATSAAGALAPAATATTAAVGFPDFRGKVVAFYTRESKHNHHFFADPVLVVQGGRLFVTGTIPALGHWTDGLSSAVAWEWVEDYLVYDSVEDYKTRCAEHKNKRDKEGKATEE